MKDSWLNKCSTWLSSWTSSRPKGNQSCSNTQPKPKNQTLSCKDNLDPKLQDELANKLPREGFLLRISATDFNQMHHPDWDPLTWSVSGLLVELRGKNCTQHQVVPHKITITYDDADIEETCIAIPTKKALYHNDDFYFRISTNYLSEILNKKVKITQVALVDVLGREYLVESNSLRNFLQLLEQ